MVKCIYEQEVLLKPKSSIQDYKAFAERVVSKCFFNGHKIIETKKEDGLIYIKFQYFLPAVSAGFLAQKMVWETWLMLERL